MAELSDDGLRTLPVLVVGGDASTEALVKRWRDGRRLVNAYGPTEATVCATFFECGDPFKSSPPIGRPISNTRIYVLDQYTQPVPIGVVGELYIGGAGVARGYWNLPGLTAARFIPSPFVKGDRLYRTGDLARYLPDGNLEFMGRNDSQVKVRGFRIELGEVESRLLQHPGIRDAVILAREDVPGEKRLVAYYTQQSDARVSIDALRTHLMASLPEYMVPAAYVALETMPLTPNGKLARKDLPTPASGSKTKLAAPQTELEGRLAECFSELLGVKEVDRADDFFELGGHSILTFRLRNAIMARTGIKVAITAIFEHPTVASLAALIDSSKSSSERFTTHLVRHVAAIETVCFVPTIIGVGLHYQTVASLLESPRNKITCRLPGTSPGETPLESIAAIAEHCRAHLIGNVDPSQVSLVGGPLEESLPSKWLANSQTLAKRSPI